MPRKDLDALGEGNVSRVYVAGNVREAERVEAVLESERLDYALNAEKFVWPGIFGPIRLDGVAFYVPRGAADAVREKLLQSGLKKGVVREEDDGDGGGEGATRPT